MLHSWSLLVILYIAVCICSSQFPNLCLLPTCMLSHFSCVWLFSTLWTVASQAPLSMEFSRQGYWSELPCPLPGGSPQPRDWIHIFCVSCIAGRFFTAEPPGKPNLCLSHHFSERSRGEGNGNPFQDSCLENSRQRSLTGYSPWDRKESNTTEQLTHTHITFPFGNHKFKFVFYFLCVWLSFSFIDKFICVMF